MIYRGAPFGRIKVHQDDYVSVRLLAVLAAVLAIAALRASYAVSMPVVFSVLVIAAVWPLKAWLDRFMPSALSYIATIAAVLVILIGFLAAVYVSMAQMVLAFAGDWDRLAHTAEPLENWLPRWGLSLPAAQGRDWLIGFGRTLLGKLYTSLVYVGFIALLVMFGLPQVPALQRKLQREFAARERHEIMEAANSIAQKVRRYATITTAASVLTGIASTLVALATGLDLALLWGVLNFLLNYIPIIGNALGTVLPALYAVIQFQGWIMPAVVFAAFALLQIGISNFVYPLLQGRSLSLSPYAVIVALAFWSWLWGIAGAPIAIPLTVALVIVAAHFESTRWIALVFSSKERQGAQ
jgi:predicted PurR-regulated permease PerM